MRSWFFLALLVASHSLLAAHTSRRQYIEVVSCTVLKGKIVVVASDGVYELKRLRTDSKGAYICPSDIISVQKSDAFEATDTAAVVSTNKS